MTQIVVNYITGGTFPVNVYIADKYGNNKSFIGVVDPGPVPPVVYFNVTIPAIFSTAKTVMLILEDDEGCEIFKLLDCPEQTFQVCLIFQDGRAFGTQDANPDIFEDGQICAQQSATTYIISAGFSDSTSACASSVFTQQVYSAVGDWEYIQTLYYNSELTYPFDGEDLWYKAEGENFVIQITPQGQNYNNSVCP